MSIRGLRGYKKVKPDMYVAARAVLLAISLLSGVYAPTVDDFYPTKEGSLVAVTPQMLNDVLARTGR